MKEMMRPSRALQGVAGRCRGPSCKPSCKRFGDNRHWRPHLPSLPSWSSTIRSSTSTGLIFGLSWARSSCSSASFSSSFFLYRSRFALADFASCSAFRRALSSPGVAAVRGGQSH